MCVREAKLWLRVLEPHRASHIVQHHASSAKRRGLGISKNLDLPSPLTDWSFESRACERNGDLKNTRVVSVASNLTYSDKGHPFRLVLAFLRGGQPTILGQTKIVEESDDSRITTTRTLVCHIHSTYSYSTFLVSVHGSIHGSA